MIGKTKSTDLVADVVSSYDQTKTTVFGRCQTKTIDGDTALGPPLNKFIDIFTDAGITPTGQTCLTPNGRFFAIQAEAAGLAVISLHTVDLNTGTTAYVGKIQISLPDTAATTHTYKSLDVIDTGTTGWKILLASTGSVTINGGLFLVNSIDLADFVSVGFPTISFATGNNQKAVYFLQDPSNIGAGQLNIASVGSALDLTNNKIYIHNGVSATHQYYVYNTNTSPTYSTNSVTGVAATDVISDAGHTFVNGDQLRFVTLTGGAGLVAGTVYFVVNSVAGVSYQLSATSGGAAFNFTTDITSASIGRAFGITGSNFAHKTGNLPALTGTLITSNSDSQATPGHTANSGENCTFFATSINLYLGKLSDLTAAAVTWPSLITANLTGSSNQITAPTAAFATWSNFLDRAIYTTNTNIFVIKQFINNSIENIFGGNGNVYYEGISTDAIPFQPATFTGIAKEAGWIIAVGSTVGQRGAFLIDAQSNYQYDYSYFITKVLDIPHSSLDVLCSKDKLFAYTGSLSIYYRTSGFGSATGGWTALPFSEDISGYASGDQIQFKVYFDTLGLDTSIHAQMTDFILGYSSLNQISENWVGSVDNTTFGTTTPAYSAFRLVSAYPSTVPTLYFRAYSDAGVLIASSDTTTTPGDFEYSTDNGTSWNALGTIPNTAITTEVRYKWSTPPGVRVTVSLRES